jgi:hypothetical protein
MSRLHFKSALAGALVGGLLAAGLAPVAATIGDALIIGESNTAHAQTELRGNVATQNLKVYNSNPSGTGLNIQVKPHNPPFVVNTSFKVKRLNADYVDGFSGTDLQNSGYSVYHDAATEIPGDTTYQTLLTLTNLPAGSYVIIGKAWFENNDTLDVFMDCRLLAGNQYDQTRFGLEAGADVGTVGDYGSAAFTVVNTYASDGGEAYLQCKDFGTNVVASDMKITALSVDTLRNSSG